MLIDLEKVVSEHQAVFTKPVKYVPQGDTPKEVNPSVSVDAPILGNGDMTCAYVYNAPYPQFWVSTNDFWEMKSQGWDMIPCARTGTHWHQGINGPRTLGRVVFYSEALKDCSCVTKQDFLTAQTESEYIRNGKKVLTLSSYISASENLLVVRIKAFEALGMEYFFLFPETDGWGSDYKADLVNESPEESMNFDDGILSGFRHYHKNVHLETKLGFACRFMEMDEQKVNLEEGGEVTFIMAVRSMEKVSRPERYARSRVLNADFSELRRDHSLHLSWWKQYFSRSGIHIDDKKMEQRYYLSQYVMGSLSRDLHYPPNLFGVSISDNPRWMGNYKINYNHQAPYYALYSSDHLEQADPHDLPYLDLLDQARDMSRTYSGHKGAVLPLGLGPKGMTSETFTMRMRGCNAMGICNMAMRWYVSFDPAYARRIYPYVAAVVDYWCNDAVLEDGVYNIYDECAAETVESENYFAKNASGTLGYIRTAIELALSIIEELEIEEPQMDHWKDVLEHLAPYPVLEADRIEGLFRIEGKTIRDFVPAELLPKTPVYLSEEEGKQWAFRFNTSMFHVYPAGQIGMGSSEEERKLASDTFRLKVLIEDNCSAWKDADPENGFNTTPYLIGRGAFADPNMASLIFPTAVRIGYDPEEIWSRLSDLLSTGRANGFFEKNPHGPENCSLVPNVMHEMMLLSHENVLRFYKNWPVTTHPNASFEGILAYGAFKVSASLSNGVVCDIRILSRAGKNCTIENPWPGRNVSIRSAYQNQILSGERISFDTREGELLFINPSEENETAAAGRS